MLENQDKFRWDKIFELNYILSEDQKKIPITINFLKNLNYLKNSWDWICFNKDIKFTEKIIDYFSDKIEFKELSYNTSTLWTFNLLKKYRGNWDWKRISKNKTIAFELSIQFIEYIDIKMVCENHKIRNKSIDTYQKIIDFNALSKNTSTELNPEMIDKYFDKWDWVELFRNKSIDWEKFPKTIIKSGFEIITTKHKNALCNLIDLCFLPWNKYDLDINCNFNSYKNLLNNSKININDFLENNFIKVLNSFLSNEEPKSHHYYEQSAFDTDFKYHENIEKGDLIEFLKNQIINNYNSKLLPKEFTKEYFDKFGVLLNWNWYKGSLGHAKYFYKANYIAKNPDSELSIEHIQKYTSQWKIGYTDIPFSDTTYGLPSEWDFYFENNKHLTPKLIEYIITHVKEIFNHENKALSLLIENENFQWTIEFLDKVKIWLKKEQLIKIISNEPKFKKLFNDLMEYYVSIKISNEPKSKTPFDDEMEYYISIQEIKI